MKIAILGLPGAGKTTLAKIIAQQYIVEFLHLDDFLFDYNPKTKTRIQRNKNDFTSEIEHVTRRDNWVIEGVYMFDNIISSADIIFCFDTKIYEAIYRQWKRRFTDSNQRKKYSVMSNLKLSYDTIKLFFLTEGSKISTDLRFMSVHEIKDTYYKQKHKTFLIRQYKEAIPILDRYVKNKT